MQSGDEPDRGTRGTKKVTPPLTDPTDRRPLQVIQAGRGIAVALVVLFHAASIAEFYLQHELAAGIFIFGYAGVDVFFVLSGLIITWTFGHDVGQPDRLWRFLVRRAIRIYPVFWIVALVLMPIYFGLPRDARDVAILLRSFLLLDPLDNPVVTVAWSLTHELFFYGMFALAIALPWRVARRVYSVWLLLSAVSYVAAFVTNGRLHVPTWAAFWLSPYNLEFAIGCVTGYALRAGVVGRGRLLVPVGAAIFLLSGLNEEVLHRYFGQRHSIVCYGFPSMLLAWGAVQWERRTNPYVPRMLVLLGDASYSIYLTHYALLDLLAKASIAGGVPAVLGPGSTISLIILVTLVIGVAFHKSVERPLLARLRRRAEATRVHVDRERGTRLLLAGALALTVLAALAIAGRGYRDFWVSYDILPDYENAANFVARGWLPIRGTLTSLGAYSPPGFSWLYVPGAWLFPGHPGLAEALGSAILFAGTVVALGRLLGTSFGVATTIGTVALFAFSSIGSFYASSLWPRAHVCFYGWTVYYLQRWALERRANAFASALAAYLLGLYCFIEIAPLGLLFPIVFAIYRPPIGRISLLACGVLMTFVWLPYLSYEVARSGADLRLLVTLTSGIEPQVSAEPASQIGVTLPGILSAAVLGNYVRGLTPAVGVALLIATMCGLAFASSRGRQLIERAFVATAAPLSLRAQRLHQFLAVSLLAPWGLMLLLVLKESLDPSRRFWWLWLLQVYFIGFTVFWILPRLRLRRPMVVAAQAVMVLAILPVGAMRVGVSEIRRSGYAGSGNRLAAVDCVASMLEANGRRTAAIGYELAVPSWQRGKDGRFIFKVGNDYDLVFRRRHDVDNLSHADIGFSADDEFRIVELASRDAWRDVTLRSQDREQFTEIGRYGSYWVGWRLNAGGSPPGGGGSPMRTGVDCGRTTR